MKTHIEAASRIECSVDNKNIGNDAQECINIIKKQIMLFEAKSI